MKIQEMAFVILALALLAIIALMFFLRFQSSGLQKAGELANQQTAASLRDRIIAMQEFSCSKGELCLDEDKINISAKYNLKGLFQGLEKADVKRIYPKGEDVVLYQAGTSLNQSYSTFVNLCRQERKNSMLDWNCGLGMLEVWIKA